MASGILRLELPIRLPGLGHVNCYAIPDARGAALVDPGLPGPGTWGALRERLAQAQLRPRDIHTVIVTHSHPDHFGCASRLAREMGATVVAHRSFRFGPYATNESEVSVDDLAAHHRHTREIHGSPVRDHELPDRMKAVLEERDARLARARTTRRTPWGTPRRQVAPPLVRLWWHAAHWVGRSFVPRITHPVEHGDRIELANREWRVVHTPGHTADHFCLHDPEGQVLLAGDHVLPTITPHISGMGVSPDPLAAFFHSLDRIAATRNVERVLPAHGHPFTNLVARTESIKRHHLERLARVVEISR
ncbi:MAG: MBL fold metallo-hydrolase, partial [Myxococcales bacterium]|nr:MBL fold metallo-hydrolase [Myxococcales bacterium]